MRRRRPFVAAFLVVALATAQCVLAEGEGGEREMGERFLLEARSELPLVEDPAVREYVESLGNRLVDSLGPQPFDYHFFVVQSPVLNAFSVPGGYIFVFSGLLARVGSDDELAGVLGHEIGHAHAHHVVRMQTQGMAWNVASLLGVFLAAINPVLAAGAIAAAQTAQLKYSRDFEQEADYLGVTTSSQAGYDPEAMPAFFKQLLIEQRVNPAGVPPYMLSHPITEERISHAEAVIKSRGLKTPAGHPKSSPEFEEARAVANAVDGPPEVAIANYKKLADDKPDDAQRQFLLGRVYQTVGKPDAAKVALEKARDLGYGNRVDRPLGAVYVALKQPEQGATILQRYLGAHPVDAWAHLQLGKALADEGKNDQAIGEFQRAVRLDGDLDEAHRLLGMSLGRQGDQGQGFYQLAVAAKLRGDLQQAYSLYDRARPLLAEGSPQRDEVDAALEELGPVVREIERERSQRRRGMAASPAGAARAPGP